MELYSKANLPWPPTDSDYTREGIEHYKHLPTRQQQCIFYHHATANAGRDELAVDSQQGRASDHHDTAAPDRSERVVDVNKSLPWQVKSSSAISQPRGSHCACLVSSSRPWLMLRKRQMLGVEALLLQGWNLSDIISPDGDGTTSFTEPVLLGMAGNAMNMFVLTDLLLSAFLATDWQRGVAIQAPHFVPLAGIGEAEHQGGTEIMADCEGADAGSVQSVSSQGHVVIDPASSLDSVMESDTGL